MSEEVFVSKFAQIRQNVKRGVNQRGPKIVYELVVWTSIWWPLKELVSEVVDELELSVFILDFTHLKWCEIWGKREEPYYHFISVELSVFKAKCFITVKNEMNAHEI